MNELIRQLSGEFGKAPEIRALAAGNRCIGNACFFKKPDFYPTPTLLLPYFHPTFTLPHNRHHRFRPQSRRFHSIRSCVAEIGSGGVVNQRRAARFSKAPVFTPDLPWIHPGFTPRHGQHWDNVATLPNREKRHKIILGWDILCPTPSVMNATMKNENRTNQRSQVGIFPAIGFAPALHRPGGGGFIRDCSSATFSLEIKKHSKHSPNTVKHTKNTVSQTQWNPLSILAKTQ